MSCSLDISLVAKPSIILAPFFPPFFFGIVNLFTNPKFLFKKFKVFKFHQKLTRLGSLLDNRQAFHKPRVSLHSLLNPHNGEQTNVSTPTTPCLINALRSTLTNVFSDSPEQFGTNQLLCMKYHIHLLRRRRKSSITITHPVPSPQVVHYSS